MRRSPLLIVLLLLVVACGGNETSATAQEGSGSPAEQAAVDQQDVVIPEINGIEVEPGLVFAGQPSTAELRQLSAAGYRVLDLRGPAEDRGFDEPALATELGLMYQNVAVDGAALLDEQVHAAFRQAVKAEGEGPLLVHCASGNRVAGLYYAMLVEEEGMSRENALARAKEFGLTSAGVESGIEAYLDR